MANANNISLRCFAEVAGITAKTSKFTAVKQSFCYAEISFATRQWPWGRLVGKVVQLVIEVFFEAMCRSLPTVLAKKIFAIGQSGKIAENSA